SHASWTWVADALTGRVSFIAPDLRGRGASNALLGPFGMVAHAADLVAVLDHFELSGAVVVGHSMGAWVGATLAARHLDRVRSLILVDGGVPQKLPDGVDLETHAAAVLGPALSRLDMTFPSETAYLDYWRAHPAFAAPGAWDAHLEHYARWDLDGEAPQLRPRPSREAATTDLRDLLGEAGLDCRRVRSPVRLMRAPRGLLNQPEPLLSDESVAKQLPTIPGARYEMVEGTNHYTIVMGVGAPVVADRILAAVQATADPAS
ncbi:MAG: alpha/beta hydrolase, partial [Myxococcota bacterium]|nr:alpha/beta hydrolase [Myxococcota bacterium]